MADEKSGPVTEIVYVPLKAGVDLESLSNKPVFEECLNTIANQAGVKAFYWGRQIEHPDVLQMLIGTYISSTYSPSFLSLLSQFPSQTHKPNHETPQVTNQQQS
jgi:hypothetical protein